MLLVWWRQRSQKCFTLVQPGELLVYDRYHVGGGGAPARLSVHLLGTAPGQPGRPPGRQYLGAGLRAGRGSGGPVKEGGQTAGQHVSLAPTPPGRPCSHTFLRHTAVRDQVRRPLVEDGDVAHGVGEVLHQPRVRGHAGGDITLEHGLHQAGELHGVGSDDGLGVT